MNVSASITQLDVTVILTEDEEAFVYCNAYESSKAYEPSIVDLYLDGASTLYSTTAVANTVSIKSLSPSTAYDVYCMTKSKKNRYMSQDTMLLTIQKVSTDCCKSVVADVVVSSFFESSYSLDSMYITLDTLPSDSITVAISAYVNGTTTATNNIMFYPSTVTFSDVISTKKVTFVSKNAGYYRVVLTISGSSSSEFSSKFVNNNNVVTVLAIGAEPPTPVLLSAKFSDDGSYVTVTFDSATDKAGYSSKFTCSEILTFSDSSKASCYWSTDGREITVYQPSSSTLLVPGDSVTVVSGTIKAKCTKDDCSDWTYISSSSVTIATASSPVVPRVLFNAPAVIGGCDSFTLDISSSTGNGGREWDYVNITVSSSDDNQVSTLQRLISNSTVYSYSPASTITSSYFKAGATYLFAVKVCNFLDSCSESIHVLKVSSSSALRPQVRILGSSTQYSYVYSAITLQASASVTDCDGNLIYSGIKYSWSVYDVNNNDLDITNQAKSDSKFVREAYSFDANTKYYIKVTATYTSEGTSATYKILLSTLTGDIVPVISGGSYQTVRLGHELTVDGSGSYDIDLADKSLSNLNYTWSCVTISPAYSENCSISMIESEQNGYLTVAALDAAYENYTSRITMTTSDATREAAAYVDIKIIASSSPVVTMVTSDISAFDTGKMLSLTGSISTTYACTAKWTVDDTNIDLSKVALSLTSSTVKTSKELTLKLDYNALSERSTYVFTLGCSKAEAVVKVVTNGPPVSGSFSVSPSSGTELSTSFQFYAAYWIDSDLPISYQYSFLSPTDGTTNVVLVKSLSSSGKSLLPAGSSSDNYAVTLVARIFDSYDAYTESYSSAEVLEYVAPASNMTALLTSTLSSASGSDSAIQSSISVISSVLNRVNCTLAPNCTSLRRSGCSVVDHTCGECFDNYLGDTGYANTKCYTETELDAKLSDSSVSLKSCVSPSCNDAGNCTYFSTDSGSQVSECYDNDALCEAVCVCANGYGGAVCQFTSAELSAKQSIRDDLLSALSSLTTSDDATETTLATWSSSLVSLAANSHELSANASQNVLDLASSLFSSSSDISIDYSDTIYTNILSSVDKSSTSVKYSTSSSDSSIVRRKLTSTDTESIITVVSGYNDVVSSQLVEGQSSVDLIYSNFRSSVASLSIGDEASNLTLSTPLTDYEKKIGVIPVNISIPVSSSSDDQSLPISVLVMSEALFDSSAMQSNPLRISISDTSNIADDIVFTLQNIVDLTYPVNETVILFNTSCAIDEESVNTFTCPRTGYTLTHTCKAFPRVVRFESVCPYTFFQASCNVYDATTGVTGQSSDCRVLSYTESNTTCACSATSNSRRLGSDTAVLDVVGVVEETTDEFTGTFGYAAPLFTTNSIAKVYVVLSLFVAVWVLGIAISLALIRHNRASIKDIKSMHEVQGRKVKSADSSRSPAAVRQYLLDYINETFPAVFGSSKGIGRFVTELSRHHSYIKLMVGAKESTDSEKAIKMTEMLTVQTFLIFSLALFYNLQAPADDGSCVNHVTQEQCLAKKSVFDSTVSYCSWSVIPTDDTVYNYGITTHFMSSIPCTYSLALDTSVTFPAQQVEYQCEYSEIEISWTMMLFISIIISAFNSIIGWFFDALFQTLLAPLPDSHMKKAVVPAAENAAPRARRQMGTVLKSNAKKLMLINKLNKNKVCVLIPVLSLLSLTHFVY